jgi:hypothetical protein
METSTVLEYLLSVVPTPPPGLTDDHILLLLSIVHFQNGHLDEARAAGMEIYSTAKRRRRLEQGVGTYNQWRNHYNTWISFCHDFTKAGYDLAAFNCAMECLRLCTVQRSDAKSTITIHTAKVDKEEEGKQEEEVTYVYVPKRNVDEKMMKVAAMKIQKRYRQYKRGKLSEHLKKEALKELSNEMMYEVPYIRALFAVGSCLCNIGEIDNGRKSLHQCYLLSYSLQQNLLRLNLWDTKSHAEDDDDDTDRPVRSSALACTGNSH